MFGGTAAISGWITTCGLDAWAPLTTLREGLRRMAKHFHIQEKMADAEAA